MAYNGGTLRDVVTVERASTAAGSYNEPVETWAEYATVWGRKTDVSAREARASMEIGAAISVRFLVRYDPEMMAVTPKDRIVCDGITYEITGVREVAGSAAPRTFIEIDAVTRADK